MLVKSDYQRSRRMAIWRQALRPSNVVNFDPDYKANTNQDSKDVMNFTRPMMDKVLTKPR